MIKIFDFSFEFIHHQRRTGSPNFGGFFVQGAKIAAETKFADQKKKKMSLNKNSKGLLPPPKTENFHKSS
jgi:hypothetical protein